MKISRRKVGKSTNIIDEWLLKHGDPNIEKEVKEKIRKMSTKIYNAYKTTLKPHEILDKLVKMRKDVLGHIYSIIMNSIMEESIEFYDLYDVLPEDSIYKKEVKNPDYFDEFINITIKMNIESSENSYLSLFQGFEVSVHVREDFSLVTLFGYNDLINSFVEDNSDWLEDFHYQNSTDKSADISDEEWDERRDIWDEIYNFYGSASETAFTYTFLSSNNKDNKHLVLFNCYHTSDPTKIVFPSDEKRKKRQIRSDFFKEEVAKIGLPIEEINESPFTYYNPITEDFRNKWDSGYFKEKMDNIILKDLNSKYVDILRERLEKINNK